MKKSLIALAVAGALAAPMAAQADATLYGSLRIKLVDNDATNLDVQDNSSRIGVRGSSDLFSGAKAIFQFEQAVSTETGAWSSGRLANLGITGDFGTAIFGRIWTPYYNWTGAQTDVSDSSVSAASVYEIGLHRASNIIAYVTPNMSGFTAAVAVAATEDAADENVDVSHVAANYNANGLNVGASYLDIEGSGEEVVSLGAGYTMGDLYVAARYEDRDLADQTAWELAATYDIGNTKLVAGFIDDEISSDDQWVIEVQQKLGKQARVFASIVEYGGAADNGFEVGYRVDF
ncbi:MAG: porin [Marinobacterium sp.]|nr:porin [Marinobacterium sp.]